MSAEVTLERRRFSAMGSTVELTTVGGRRSGVIDAAEAREHDLERRRRRCVESSEVSALNRLAGATVRLSDDTLLLVELARRAWHETGGRFDPTVLRAVEAAGYTDSFDRLGSTVSRPPADERAIGACHAIEVDRRAGSVRLPSGGGFDPGGIGKGLAADLVSHELSTSGVDGGCVNLGGDLRVWGVGPRGGGWRVGLGARTIELTDVGVATSGTRRRAWQVDGEAVHHLIDPTTSRPSTSGPDTITVIAGAAWRAETSATALSATAGDDVAALAERWGVRAILR